MIALQCHLGDEGKARKEVVGEVVGRKLRKGGAGAKKSSQNNSDRIQRKEGGGPWRIRCLSVGMKS
jgi:hypothetical protein